ncbi:monothiol glutaredoxin-5 [Saitoella complicata NRRL Y-17804]|nr:monothiol glutaredoxin-5 [Saitoella complicata NRRL Y-17804]ODQ52845.1 monothiol glutaredoxin-5 [Saitoella complicata NRRL Y-17804]
MVREITSVEDFEQFITTSNGSVIALNFWAPWAAPCAQMNVVFEELSTRYPSVKFAKIEAEELADISESFDVSAVPFFVILKSNKVLARISGGNAPELTAALNQYSSATSLPPAQPVAPPVPASAPQVEEDLETRLGNLVKAAPVMLFMKGTPAAPQCGFSRTLVGLLRERGVRYGFFNILADDEVRQGLKEYSDWPTFPQVYVKGELVGGLDIVREMIDNGEWDDVLKDAGVEAPVASSA